MTKNQQPDDIATSALELIIKNRGYSDKHTIELLKNTVHHCMQRGNSLERVIKELCRQLSHLTNISFDEWLDHLYPCEYSEIKTLRSMLDRLQMHLPEKAIEMMGNINIPLMTPIDSYRLICHIEHEICIDSAPVKWSLLAQFADRGCLYSMLSLGHLLMPLSPNDPVIGKNKEVGNQLFSFAIQELSIGDGKDEIGQFVAKFQNMVCEAYLKHGSYLLSTASRAREGQAMIEWAEKHSSSYSRVKRYIKQYHQIAFH